MEKGISRTDGKLIIVTGPESTGKTTIACALAEEYNGIFVPEFARDYIQQLDRKYTYADIVQIALKQKEQYMFSFENNHRGPIVLDTFLIITKIWMIWNSGKYETWIDKVLKNTRNALYLLCAPDIDWVADNVRENGGVARERLFNVYRDELEKFKLNYAIITGAGTKRYNAASDTIKKILKTGN
jgi:NadR type nicotinamide-nucleotide adenylyltransferase